MTPTRHCNLHVKEMNRITRFSLKQKKGFMVMLIVVHSKLVKLTLENIVYFMRKI